MMPCLKHWVLLMSLLLFWGKLKIILNFSTEQVLKLVLSFPGLRENLVWSQAILTLSNSNVFSVFFKM